MIDEALSIGNTWVDVMLAWDRKVAAHSSRLIRPAQATGRLLGLAQDALYRLGLAALVHDLGKMAIPQAILSKPGPLTEEEWLGMHRHPELGCSMLLHAGGAVGASCLSCLLIMSAGMEVAIPTAWSKTRFRWRHAFSPSSMLTMP